MGGYGKATLRGTRKSDFCQTRLFFFFFLPSNPSPDLRYNLLQGTLPTQLGQMTSLTALLLHSNQIGGSLISQLGQLTALNSYLYLSQNSFSGTIPYTLGALTGVKQLYLYSNSLAGSIPAS